MSLYREYLDTKSELLLKELNFKTALTEWFSKQEGIELLQPVDVEPNLIMDHFTITTIKEFNQHIGEFENEFNVKCVRIFHNQVIIPEGDVKEYWKFSFKER